MKKYWAVLLVICMVIGTLSGCGNSESSKAPQTSVGSQSGQTAGYNVTWDDVVDIRLLAMDAPQAITEDQKQRVLDAINEITENEIKVHVDMDFINMGSYAQQVSLIMSSQEKLDLLLTMPMDSASFQVLANNKQLTDMTDLLEEYGQPVKNVVGDLIKGTTVQGKIYAVPCYRSMSSGLSVYINKDILEDLGLTEQAQNIKSWSDLTDLYDTILANEKYANLTPVIPGPGPCIISKSGSYNAKDTFAQSITWDSLGDATKLIAVIGDSDTVINNFESQEYKDMIHLMEEWDAKGYVYKDALTDTSGTDRVKNGQAISCIIDTEFGSELAAAPTYGNVTKISVVQYPISTSTVTKFTWAIPQTSQEPEAAMTFLNMMYTDSRIANLLAWGVEGTDYQLVDGIAKYMEGKDKESYHSFDFAWGNQFLLHPWEGQPADFRKQQETDLNSVPLSKYLGFSVDMAPISNELSAASVAINEYIHSIDCGFGDDAMYEEFLAKLKANGCDKIIEEYQRQLDEWLAVQ